MSKNSQKYTKRAVALLLAGVLTLGAFNGIGAYFTSTDKASDTYTIGKVQIELSGSSHDFDKELLMPLEEYAYEREVKNTGLNPAYVFMTVRVPAIETETINDNAGKVLEQTPYTQVLTYGIKNGGNEDEAGTMGVNSQFKLIENGKVAQWTIEDLTEIGLEGRTEDFGAIDPATNTITYVYAYVDGEGNLAPLAKDNSTGNLFDLMKVANLADAENMKAEGLVQVNAYAIQTNNILTDERFAGVETDGTTDIEKVWSVVNNACYIDNVELDVDDLPPSYYMIDKPDDLILQGEVAAFRSNAPYEKLAGVMVDGELVDPSNYKTFEGSTIVELTGDFTKTLEEGDHDVVIVSTDGKADADFGVYEFVEFPEPGAYFQEDDGVKFLTWNELKDSANGSRYGYKAEAISDVMIGWTAFESCKKLISMKTPDTLKTIDGYAFRSCYNFVKLLLNEGLTTINTEAFAYTGFISLDIPASVNNISRSALSFNKALTDFHVDSNNQYYMDIDGVLFSKDGKTLIRMPAGKMRAKYTIPNCVEDIAYGAFIHSSKLEKLVIPEGVSSTDSFILWSCENLESLTIPSTLTNMGRAPFNDCKSLINVYVDDSNLVYEDIDGVFYTKDGVLLAYPGGRINTSYKIPEGTTNWEEQFAFDAAKHLREIYFPSSFSGELGSSLTQSCPKLTDIYLSLPMEKVENILSLRDYNQYYKGNVAIHCDDGEFVHEMICIHSETHPERDTDTTHVLRCFDCYEIIGVEDCYASYEFEGQYYCMCGNVVDEAPSYIDADVVMYNITTQTYEFADKHEVQQFEEDNYHTIMMDRNLQEQISQLYETDGGTLVIKNIDKSRMLGYSWEELSEMGYNVSDEIIFDNAFENCSALVSINIPDSVVVIGANAFAECDNLETVKFGPDSQLTKIASKAFYDCDSLTEITIPDGVVSLSSESFGACRSLNSIVISENSQLEAINNGAVWGTAITEFYVPKNVDFIDASVFRNCSNLASIVVDEENAIYDSRENCNAIIETSSNILITGSDNTVVPDGIVEIGKSAFFCHTGIESINIPKSVKVINNAAFSCCVSLSRIDYEGTQAEWQSITKGSGWKVSVPTYCTVHCSDGDILI